MEHGNHTKIIKFSHRYCKLRGTGKHSVHLGKNLLLSRKIPTNPVSLKYLVRRFGRVISAVSDKMLQRGGNLRQGLECRARYITQFGIIMIKAASILDEVQSQQFKMHSACGYEANVSLDTKVSGGIIPNGNGNVCVKNCSRFNCRKSGKFILPDD